MPAAAQIDVLILRDPRESKRKCSLTPLAGLEAIRFVEYRRERTLQAGSRILLHPDGEELGPRDRADGLLLIDCAWRRVPSLLATVEGDLVHRRLPPLVTAYPRRSKTFEDPAAGLASVEALYAALSILGAPREDILAAYPFREAFLERNRELLPGTGA